MVNRYAGEIRINPIAILRKDDFNNSGEIENIEQMLAQTIQLHESIRAKLMRLKEYLRKYPSANREFFFADGGYIGLKGFADTELLALKSEGLIDLFDFAVDKGWVKKYGAQLGGEAVKPKFGIDRICKNNF